MAVFTAAAPGPESQAPDLLDVQRRRVQTAQIRGGGQVMGPSKEQDQHEL